MYFVDYDMVQSEMLFLAKGDPFKAENMAASRLFNTYFGSGLSSIVFQEIRESKSLAYSAWSSYSTARKKRRFIIMLWPTLVHKPIKCLRLLML